MTDQPLADALITDAPAVDALPPSPPPPTADPHPASAPPLDHHGGAKTRGLRPIPRSSVTEGKFGWLFRSLPAYPALTDDQILALVASLTEPADAVGGTWGGGPRDNTAVPAIYTYLAQLLDHDVTFDAATDGQRRDDPDALYNYRTPRLDLDSVYGSGPKVSPHLYQKGDKDKLLLGAGGNDLPRNSEDIALIGDPRDDVHIVTSQLHLALLHFHNNVVEKVRNEPGLLPAGAQIFDVARQLVRWHWQWVIVHDLLPKVVGAEDVPSLVELGWRSRLNSMRRLRQFRSARPSRGERVGAGLRRAGASACNP